MSEKKIKKVLMEGPISPQFIGDSIAKHQVKTNIGAHDIFLGQVRADVIDGAEVTGIEYSAYDEMADKVFHEIRESAFEKFDLNCMHIYHSTGLVPVGEICLFVFVSSAHRKEAIDANRFIVEAIKEQAPVFGKEMLSEGGHVWKENK